MLLLITHNGRDGEAREWELARLQVSAYIYMCACMHDCVCDPQLCRLLASGLSIRGKEGLQQREIPVQRKERVYKWRVTKNSYLSTVLKYLYFFCPGLASISIMKNSIFLLYNCHFPESVYVLLLAVKHMLSLKCKALLQLKILGSTWTS